LDPAATASPTQLTIQLKLPPFTLEYEIPDFQEPTQSDLTELESLTAAYLKSNIFGALASSDVLLEDFLTDIVSVQSDPDSLVVLITFESTALFDPLSPVIPTEGQIVDEIINAFTGEELNGYLGMVQALPNMNLFSDTSQVFLVGTPDPDPNPVEASDASAVTAIAAAAAGIVLLSSGVAALLYYRRRRRRRREASNKLLRDVVEAETSSDSASSASRSLHRGEDIDTNDEEKCVNASTKSWRDVLVENRHDGGEVADNGEGNLEDTYKSWREVLGMDLPELKHGCDNEKEQLDDTSKKSLCEVVGMDRSDAKGGADDEEKELDDTSQKSWKKSLRMEHPEGNENVDEEEKFDDTSNDKSWREVLGTDRPDGIDNAENELSELLPFHDHDFFLRNPTVEESERGRNLNIHKEMKGEHYFRAPGRGSRCVELR
jgi:hypothetical protein